MIKLKKVRQIRHDDSGNKYVDAYLFADTKEEVTNSISGRDVSGLENDVILDTGSLVVTATFDVAQLNSSHQWKWGDE